MRLIWMLGWMALLLMDDGPGDGRKGNQLYQQKKYAEAAQAYRQGISRMKPEPNPTLSGLYNNLGSTLYRQQQYDKANEAFTRSALAATDQASLARAAYNRGNAAYAAQKPEEALNAFRQALLANPNDAQARYNYELVKRQMQQQKNPQSKPNPNQQNQQQQNQPQQQNQQNQQQNQQQQHQQNQQQQNQQNQPQQQNQQQPKPEKKLNPQQARQILDAMKNDEEQLLQALRRKTAQSAMVEKDW